MSVTDIEYVAEQKSLQIISRVFADDLEDVLEKRYSTRMILLPNEETENADEMISRYLNQKLNLAIKGEALQIQYIGKRFEDDRVYLYVEIENVPNFTSISVENLILTDLYEDQKNLVHVKKNKETKSKVLTKANSSYSFTY